MRFRGNEDQSRAEAGNPRASRRERDPTRKNIEADVKTSKRARE